VTECLYFVDILRGRVHRACGDATSRNLPVGRMVGAAALTDAGDLVLAAQGGFARLDPDSGAVRAIASVDADRADVRMNDGKCDPQGRFWAGTMALDERPHAGRLYRLDARGAVETMLSNVSISNGLDWTSDGGVMYFIDSPTQIVDAFDFDGASGGIANRRPVVHVDPRHGVPDGLTLDADGCLWVALWGGAAVHRYTPDGALDAIVPVPTGYPTSCAFGGSDLRDLFITTASVKLSVRDRAAQPSAGGIFVARPRVRGRTAHRFKG